MGVDRCICHNVTFAELLRMHRETGAAFEALRERTGCGSGCGLCEPYVRLAIKTGRTALPVMSLDDLAELREEFEGADRE